MRDGEPVCREPLIAAVRHSTMSVKNWLPLQSALQAGAFIALALAIVFLVAAIAGWRGPFRTRRLARFALCLGAVPFFPLTHAAILYGVVFPYEARQAERRKQERVDAVSFVNVHEAAPSFSITDTSGVEFVLADLRGKVVLVTFFATWCGPCLLELPHVQKLWDDNRENDDFVLIAIAIGREDTNESVAAFQSKHGYTFPMASDPQRASYSLFAAELIPRTYLVSRDGTICFTSTGFYEEESARLQRELAKQLRSTP
jgi:peroxiredoxin